MRLSSLWSACGVVLLAALLMSPACAGVNLIRNGDFEMGGDFWSWTTVDGAGRLIGGGFVLNDNGTTPDPTLFQTVYGLTVGQAYTLAGDYRAYHTTGGSTHNAFSAWVDDIVLKDFDLPQPNGAWGVFSLDFVATSNTHTIYLAGERDGSDYSTQVDNISLTQSSAAAVPEPSAIVLAVMGLSSIGGAFLRRRK